MEDCSEIEKIIKLTLIRIGIKCDMVGFVYLEKAIEFVIESPFYVYNLKDLFKKVAEYFGVQNSYRVEANIQNAISATYDLRGFDAINEIFHMEVFEPKRKPSTAELIKLIAEYYKLKLYEVEKSMLGI